MVRVESIFGSSGTSSKLRNTSVCLRQNGTVVLVFKTDYTLALLNSLARMIVTRAKEEKLNAYSLFKKKSRAEQEVSCIVSVVRRFGVKSGLEVGKIRIEVEK